MNDRFNLNVFRSSTITARRTRTAEITDEIYNTKFLSISYLAIDLPGKSLAYRKNLARQWRNVLPTLTNLTLLDIRARVDEDMLDAISQMSNLEALGIITSPSISIHPLGKLSRLTYLGLDSFSRLTDLSPITNLKNLELLSITNCMKIENYERIAELDKLIGLSLEGDTASPKNLRLKSLKPFSTLKALRHLDLTMTTVIDKSYDTVLTLPNLERLDLVATMPKMTRQKIKAHPKLKAGFFMDWDFENNCFYPGKIW